MQPDLQPGVFVFCSVHVLPSGIDPLCVFREAEGISVIVGLEEARRLRLRYAFPSRLITLKVHSSLEAVGYLAVITGRLAEAGISVNPVSGFYHDHLFVPKDRAEEALAILGEFR